MTAIPNREEGDRLFRGYIHHHISAYDCSLYEMFKITIPDDDTVLALVSVLSSLLERSRKKAKELDTLEKTGLATESTLDHNLDDLLNCVE